MAYPGYRGLVAWKDGRKVLGGLILLGGATGEPLRNSPQPCKYETLAEILRPAMQCSGPVSLTARALHFAFLPEPSKTMSTSPFHFSCPSYLSGYTISLLLLAKANLDL